MKNAYDVQRHLHLLLVDSNVTVRSRNLFCQVAYLSKMQKKLYCILVVTRIIKNSKNNVHNYFWNIFCKRLIGDHFLCSTVANRFSQLRRINTVIRFSSVFIRFFFIRFFTFLLLHEKVCAFSSAFLYVHICTNQTITYWTKVFRKFFL